MIFRSFRFNRQINKLIDAGIKIKVEQENKSELIDVKTLNDGKVNKVTDIQKEIQGFQREVSELQNEQSNKLAEMESISNSMSEKEDKAALGIVGAFFNKGYRAQRKRMSILKKQNKEIKKQIIETYKEIRKSKKQEKRAIKELNNFEKEVVKLGKEKKYEVKFINYVRKHERKIQKNCSGQEIEEIKKCVKSMQNDVKLKESDKTPKELYKLLKDVCKGKKRKGQEYFISPYKEVAKETKNNENGEEHNESEEEKGKDEPEEEKEEQEVDEQEEQEEEKDEPEEEQETENDKTEEEEQEADEQEEEEEQEGESKEEKEEKEETEEGKKDANQNQEQVSKKIEQIKQKEKELEQARRAEKLGIILTGSNANTIEIQLETLKKQLEVLEGGEKQMTRSEAFRKSMVPPPEAMENSGETHTTEDEQQSKRKPNSKGKEEDMGR